MNAEKDKYDPFRFNGICPTCGQTFLIEQVDNLQSQLTEAREALKLLAGMFYDIACGDLCPVSLKICTGNKEDCERLIVGYLIKKASKITQLDVGGGE